jgi:hypothetical protein
VSTVFVVTASDVFGLGLIALLVLVAGVVIAYDRFDTWRRRRRKANR